MNKENNDDVDFYMVNLQVETRETESIGLKVKASSREEAIEKAIELYNNGDIDYSDFVALDDRESTLLDNHKEWHVEQHKNETYTLNDISNMAVDYLINEWSSCNNYDSISKKLEFIRDELNVEFTVRHNSKGETFMHIISDNNVINVYAQLFNHSENKFSIVQLTVGDFVFGGDESDNPLVTVSSLPNTLYKNIYKMFLNGTYISLENMGIFKEEKPNVKN